MPDYDPCTKCTQFHPIPTKFKKKKVSDNWSLSVITADSEMSNMALKGESSPQGSAEPEAACILPLPPLSFYSSSRLKAPPVTHHHYPQPRGAKPQEQSYRNNEQL